MLLLERNQPADFPLNISAQVLHEKNIEWAKLLYRLSGSDTSFEEVIMSSVENLYSAAIPESVVNEPGVDFYIVASDGTLSASTPRYRAALEPHQIAVVPNDKPIISHIPVEIAGAGRDVMINAHVIDATGEVDWVELRYRRGNDALYYIAPMYDDENDNYSVSIPGEMVNTTGIHYYITAEDDQGLKAHHGTPENYHEIDVGTHIVAYIPVRYENGPNNSKTIDQLKENAQLVNQYYMEQSYGAVKMLSNFVFDEWVELSVEEVQETPCYQNWMHLEDDSIFQQQLIATAIKKADINHSDYDAVVVIQTDGTGPSFASPLSYYEPVSADWPHAPAPAPISNKVYTSDSASGAVWAHELGHAIFKWYDYYEKDTSYYWSRGDTGYWELMGLGTHLDPIVPITSYLKAQDHVGWLDFENIGTGQAVPVSYLTEMSLHDSLYSYKTGSDDVVGFIIEGRGPIEYATTHPWYFIDHESNQRIMPTPGILLYQVETDNNGEYLYALGNETIERSLLGKDWTNHSVTIQAGGSYPIDDYEVIFGAYELENQLMLSVENFVPDNRTIWRKFRDSLTIPTTLLPLILEPQETDVTFDFDLKVYTADGLKVGMDYETGEYLMQIPDARGSGNVRGGGSEWISVPNQYETYYEIDTTQAILWMEAHGIPNLSLDVVVHKIVYDHEGNKTITEEFIPIELQINLSDPSNGTPGFMPPVSIRMPAFTEPVIIITPPGMTPDSSSEASWVVKKIINLISPYVNSNFVKYGTQTSYQRALSAYQEAMVIYKNNISIFNNAEKALIETWLALTLTAIETVEFNLQLAVGKNIDSSRAIEAYNYAQSMVTKNSTYLTAEQVNIATELLQSIKDIILVFMFEDAA